MAKDSELNISLRALKVLRERYVWGKAGHTGCRSQEGLQRKEVIWSMNPLKLYANLCVSVCVFPPG